MPIHDWTRVDAGIFHHFHQQWISVLTNILNDRLPREYYALAEQQGAGYIPDVLTHKAVDPNDGDEAPRPFGNGNGDGGGMLVAEPRVRVKGETDLGAYRRKQNVVTVRHVSGDQLVAVAELVSQGNKSGRGALVDFVDKAAKLLDRGIHLMVLDLQPPTPRDPNGIHGAIWEEVADQEYIRPEDKPLTLAAYEAGTVVRAFVEPVAVGDAPIDMPLFVDRGRYLAAPVDESYRVAYDSMPARWRAVLDRA